MHLHSLTVAGAAGELRRHGPRTPFPFNPPTKKPDGHLLRYYFMTSGIS